MQKDMNIESLPVAIGYEMKSTEFTGCRPTSLSMQSDGYTVETSDSGPDVDPEIPRENDGSDSPTLTLRKKF
jgi:hypothetical protein